MTDAFKDEDLCEEEPLLDDDGNVVYCCVCGCPITEKSVYLDGDWYCRDCEEEAWKEIRYEYLQKP